MPHAPDDTSVLFQTEHGTVLRCACCNRIEVVFGNIALAEEPPLFARFHRLVAGLDLDALCADHPDVSHPVVLSADGDKLAFRFTCDEARALRELLDGAAAMLELEGLLQETLHPDAPASDA
ncbi:DUF6686 family protein [Salisaeta longa]|uniref:DUF6686 family protein n=1 Tax=Salisaeta longa TaxID=503170 RepID=UPI0003B75DA6|nr:DUF6686 family protein [Salisaeta longa]